MGFRVTHIQSICIFRTDSIDIMAVTLEPDRLHNFRVMLQARRRAVRDVLDVHQAIGTIQDEDSGFVLG